MHVNQIMRDKNLDILLVQEAHLTDERRREIGKLFHRQLKIFSSGDRNKPHTIGGVAIVLNKKKTNWKQCEFKEIEQGRAIAIKLTWHRGTTLTIMNVYAPNVNGSDGAESAQFWKRMQGWIRQHPQWKPDIIAGNYNVVEDPMDRTPARKDPDNATKALGEMLEQSALYDGWRNTFPTTRMFTYEHRASASPSFSRLDRIYCTTPLLNSARMWKTQPSGIRGVDHEMVSVQITNEDAPLIGHDLWSISNKAMKDKKWIELTRENGITTMEKLKNMGQRTDALNPQKLLKNWTDNAMKEARDCEKIIAARKDKQIKELEAKLKRAMKELEEPSVEE
ncbi:Endonuclease/exonuclease/phosphatase, partial [Flagelloscypha sp. PMI_526]